jgi:putative endonuclease
MYYVYLIKYKGDKIYIGYTNNLRRRLKEHKTKRQDLIYYEAYQSKEDATEREKQLKKYKSAWGQLKKRTRRSRI